MCRDEELLSAYLDGEVSSPGKEQIEQAIQADRECRDRYEQLKRVHLAMQRAPASDQAASAERVWNRLEAHMFIREPEGFWHRGVRIPMPLMVAAAGLMVALGVALLVSVFGVGERSAGKALAHAEDTQVTINVDNMDADRLLEWLNSPDVLGQVRIQLPEDPKFEMIGEPMLVPASEYRSQSPPRGSTQ